MNYSELLGSEKDKLRRKLNQELEIREKKIEALKDEIRIKIDRLTNGDPNKLELLLKGI